MRNQLNISTGRIEAFSDGVIAIIITVMVFDLKLQEVPTDVNVWRELLKIAPKFISYAVSFIVLAIMWVNHHQLFHQIKNADRKLLWYNMLLLFCMSLIPFGTNFIGANPFLWQASFFYGIVFFLNAFAFTLLRSYVLQADLLYETIDKSNHVKIKRKNGWAMTLYIAAACCSFWSVYISFALFVVVPAMYFIPENISHQK